jgi:hypothetical protein
MFGDINQSLIALFHVRLASLILYIYIYIYVHICVYRYIVQYKYNITYDIAYMLLVVDIHARVYLVPRYILT